MARAWRRMWSRARNSSCRSSWACWSVSEMPVQKPSTRPCRSRAREPAGALCTVVRSQGSTPRHASSKMLVYPDGSIAGHGGRRRDGKPRHRRSAPGDADGKPRLLEYNMTDPSRGDPGVCGGSGGGLCGTASAPNPPWWWSAPGMSARPSCTWPHWLGFHVVVSDDRPEFCTPEAVPGADRIPSSAHG